MPSYVSHDGVLHPAKEKVGLTNITDKVKIVNSVEVQPGDPYIYEGPDRAAEFELAQNYGMDTDGKPKVVSFGMNFRQNPDIINLARQLGFKSVDEYAKAVGYDEKQAKQNFEAKAAVIIKHQQPTRKPEPIIQGGGVSTAPNNETLIGGFGEQRERPISELEKKNNV